MEITFAQKDAIAVIAANAWKSPKRNADVASTPKNCHAAKHFCAKQNANDCETVISMRAAVNVAMAIARPATKYAAKCYPVENTSAHHCVTMANAIRVL